MSENSSNLVQPPKPLFRGIAVSVGLALWVILAFFVAGFAVFGLFYGLEKLQISLSFVSSASLQLLQASLIYVLTLAIAISVPRILTKHRTSLQDLGLHRAPDWKDIGFALVAVVPYILMSVGLVLLATNYLPGFDADQVQEIGFETVTNRSGLIVAFITLVIIAPIAEEALFRGYLYGKMRRVTNIIVAILVTSVAFAFVHGQINVGLDVFALSVVLCLLREVTGSIWAGVLLHMLKNGVAFYFLFIFVG